MPLLFENLVGGSTPTLQKGGGAHYEILTGPNLTR